MLICTALNNERSACKVPDIFVLFQANLEFDRFSQKSTISNFTKIRPVKEAVLHADRHTVQTMGQICDEANELMGAFRYLCEHTSKIC